MIRLPGSIESVLAALVLALVMAAPVGAAQTTIGYTTVDLNLRAGPGTQYPILAVMPAGARVDIHGCTADYRWCDIDWRNYRGWAAGRYLQILRKNYRRPVVSFGIIIGIPFVGFNVDTYWNRHYRKFPFYRTLPDFHRPPVRQPRVEPPHFTPPHEEHPDRGAPKCGLPGLPPCPPPPSPRIQPRSFGDQPHVNRNAPQNSIRPLRKDGHLFCPPGWELEGEVCVRE